MSDDTTRALFRESAPVVGLNQRKEMLDGMKLQILSARAAGLEELLRQVLPILENAPGGHGGLIDDIKDAIKP